MVEKKRFTYKADYDWWCVFDNGKRVYSDEVVDLLNELNDEKVRLEQEVIKIIDRKIKNNDSNPPRSFQEYFKVNRALKDVREDIRSLFG